MSDHLYTSYRILVCPRCCKFYSLRGVHRLAEHLILRVTHGLCMDCVRARLSEIEHEDENQTEAN